mmetsp:Transcript_8140/g.25110  ORF Transcript_8140/g.25110 Transcript_8140/m.25110 type:complete len:345 (-) Transcript_8140:15-1049(-)
MLAEAFSLLGPRKRPAEPEENGPTTVSGATPRPPGGVTALPQLSTTRMREALAAGDPTGRLTGVRLVGAPPPVLCKFFLRGACQKGSACTFSHEVQGMPTVPVEKKLRTPCRFYELGQCMRGPACKFAHGEDEMEQIANVKSAGGGKKKARAEPAERVPEGTGVEAAVPETALAVLSSATGFQDFDHFDIQTAGETDLEARAEREVEAAPSMDTAWAAFLAQVADGKGSAVGGGAADEAADGAAGGATGRAAAGAASGAVDGGTTGSGSIGSSRGSRSAATAPAGAAASLAVSEEEDVHGMGASKESAAPRLRIWRGPLRDEAQPKSWSEAKAGAAAAPRGSPP